MARQQAVETIVGHVMEKSATLVQIDLLKNYEPGAGARRIIQQYIAHTCACWS